MGDCQNCGERLGDGARFCASCGTPIEPAPRSSHEQTALWPEGEKRRLTVLFCDIVGSTSIGRLLDAEDYTELIEAYVGRSARAIEAHGGFVAQVQGDGIVAYFGFPTAHDDDPIRAVLAGLAIQQGLERDGGVGPNGVSVQARVGIHTGPVVVNAVGGARRELLALGDTTNTAARVESTTPPGQVGISEETRKLLRNQFQIQPAREHRVKGIEVPLAVFVVDGTTARLSSATSPDLTSPFVGRESARRDLRTAMRSAAEEGRGATTLIVGEAGIGKSRLAHAALADAHHDGFRTVTIACSPYGQADAFDPIVDLIAGLLGVPADAEPAEAAAAIEVGLSLHDIALEDSLPYLLALLGLPSSPDHPLPVLGADLQRIRTLDAIVVTLGGIARRQPTAVLCEDLHWADPSTLAVLSELSTRATSMPLVMILTTRPELEWDAAGRVLSVDRLDADASRAIVTAATDGVGLPSETIEQIVERADGVPLFLEELTASVVESGDLTSIPSTLDGSLAARLDRLGSVRAIAQVAALIGRDVDRELLESVAGFSEAELASGLEALVANGILRTQDSRRYSFKHALIQDAAAGSLTRRTKRRLHFDIVDALVANFTDVVDQEPARLAHHCGEADRPMEAIGHYRRAATRASERLANQEATDHLERALALFDTLDPSERTTKVEIGLRAAYGGPLASQYGLLSEPVAANYRRLEQLEHEADDQNDQLEALLALVVRYVQVSEMEALVAAGHRVLAIAEALDMPIFAGVGHVLCGVGGTSVLPAEETLAHLDVVEHLAGKGQLIPPSSNYETDLEVLAASTKSIMFVILGRVDEARSGIERAVRRAEIELGHPFSLGTALTLASNVHLELREVDGCLHTSGHAIDLARRHGFSHFEAMNMVQHGWARTTLGADGSDDVRSGLKLLATTTMSSYTQQLRIAAMEALLRADLVEARRYVEEAVKRALTLKERGYLTYLRTIAGQIELAEGRPESAVALMADGYDEARRGGYWLPGLHAALALADLTDVTGLTGGHDVETMLRGALDHIVGADDRPEVVRAHALLA